MFPLSCKESGRKFAKPQPRRIFRCSGSFDVPDKTVPTTQRYFRHRSSPCAVVFVIDIIVIFPINLVLPAIDSIRVPLELHRKLNSHGIGKKGGRKNVWGGRKGRGSRRNFRESLLFLNGTWNKKKKGISLGWGREVSDWKYVYIRKGKCKAFVWTRGRKTFVSPLRVAGIPVRAMPIDICRHERHAL